MTTWTKEQVAQVSALRVTLDVDRELLARGSEAEVTAAVRSKMVPMLVDMGHALGVEVHPEDCELRRDDSLTAFWTVKITCAWHPRTDAVELRGGQEDGQVYAIRRLGDPLRVPVVGQTPWMSDGTSAEAALVDMALTYEFTGEWDEAARHWVYALR